MVENRHATGGAVQIEWQVYGNETVAMLPYSMKYDSEIHRLCINHHRSDSVQSGQNCPCRKDEHRQAILGFNTPQGPCYVMLHLMVSWILQMLFQLKTSSRPRKARTETVQILSMKELFIN